MASEIFCRDSDFSWFFISSRVWIGVFSDYETMYILVPTLVNRV